MRKELLKRCFSYIDRREMNIESELSAWMLRIERLELKGMQGDREKNAKWMNDRDYIYGCGRGWRRSYLDTQTNSIYLYRVE